MATLCGPVTMKIEANIRYTRSPLWPIVMAAGKVALWLGVSEDRVLQFVTPRAGTVVITCFGESTVYRQSWRDGAFRLERKP